MGGWHKEERKSSAKAESGEEKSGRKMSRARVARSTPVGGNREIYASYEVFLLRKGKRHIVCFSKDKTSFLCGGRSEPFRSLRDPLEARFRGIPVRR